MRGKVGRCKFSRRVAVVAAVYTVVFAGGLKGDIIFGPDIEHLASQIIYFGGGGSASGWLSPGILAATALVDPIIQCRECLMEFTSGGLLRTVSESAAGGMPEASSLTLLGLVVGVLLFAGRLKINKYFS